MTPAKSNESKDTASPETNEGGKKLNNLVERPHVIRGNPEDLVKISWEAEIENKEH